jgi:ubiquinone/menaquinone biosynthesis C-methylase UbiE
MVSAQPAGLPRTAVPAAFDAGAFAYDRLVGANPGYHAHLRLSARRMRLPDAGRGLRLLDAGCGTGASTTALLAAAPQAEITAIDASGEMLARARAKPWPSSVTFVHAPVDELAAAGVRGPFDGIFAAYLIRNVPDQDATLRDLRALLRPGGTLAVHEYSVRDSARARAVWQAVSLGVIIPAGQLVSGDTALYRYLRRSVTEFDGAARFRRRLRDAGFTGVHSETVPGWQHGVVHTFLASRSAREQG